HQTMRARVGQHAVDLRTEVLPQFVLKRQAEQFVVRDGSPQKKGQAGRERVLIQQHDLRRVVRFRLKLNAKQKTRRGQAGGNGHLDAVFKRFPRLPFHLVNDVHQSIDRAVVKGLAERATDETAHDLASV